MKQHFLNSIAISIDTGDTSLVITWYWVDTQIPSITHPYCLHALVRPLQLEVGTFYWKWMLERGN